MFIIINKTEEILYKIVKATEYQTKVNIREYNTTNFSIRLLDKPNQHNPVFSHSLSL